MLASSDYRRQVTKAHHALRRAYALVVSARAMVPPVAAAQRPAAEDVGAAVAHDVKVLLEEGMLRGDWEAQLEVSAGGLVGCWGPGARVLVGGVLGCQQPHTPPSPCHGMCLPLAATTGWGEGTAVCARNSASHAQAASHALAGELHASTDACLDCSTALCPCSHALPLLTRAG
jgi:hypothetical protein